MIAGDSIDGILQHWNSCTDETLAALDDVSGATLLFYAVQRQPDEEALTLANYLVKDRGVCQAGLQDANSQTALFFCARDGNANTVDFLVKQGCAPDVVDSAGQTALFYACREGHIEVIRKLIELGGNSNHADRIGQTALFYAAREGKLKACEVLVHSGANPRVRDASKKTAYAYASKRGHVEVAAFLRAKMDIDSDHVPGLKRKHSCMEDMRQKVLLQYLEPNVNEWIFPTDKLLEDFEKEFTDIVAWSRVTSSLYEPIDAFRMEWGRQCLEIVTLVSNYKEAAWFTKPVDVKALNCPDYYDVVKEPRDLGTIKKGLKDLKYDRITTFHRDMVLVWKNCFAYNPISSRVYKAGEKIRDVFEQVWEEQGMSQYIEREERLLNVLYTIDS